MDTGDDVSANSGDDWPSVAIQSLLFPRDTPQLAEVTNI